MRVSIIDEAIEGNVLDVIDMETGKSIPFVIWADEEAGEYEQYQIDEEGNIITEYDTSLTVVREGRIEVREKDGACNCTGSRRASG